MTKRIVKSKVVLTGGPYSGKTVRLSVGLGTLTFKVGAFVGFYDERGYWNQTG